METAGPAHTRFIGFRCLASSASACPVSACGQRASNSATASTLMTNMWVEGKARPVLQESSPPDAGTLPSYLPIRRVRLSTELRTFRLRGWTARRFIKCAGPCSSAIFIQTPAGIIQEVQTAKRSTPQRQPARCRRRYPAAAFLPATAEPASNVCGSSLGWRPALPDGNWTGGEKKGFSTLRQRTRLKVTGRCRMFLPPVPLDACTPDITCCSRRHAHEAGKRRGPWPHAANTGPQGGLVQPSCCAGRRVARVDESAHGRRHRAKLPS